MSVVLVSDLEGKVPKRGINLILLFVLAWWGISKRLLNFVCAKQPSLWFSNMEAIVINREGREQQTWMASFIYLLLMLHLMLIDTFHVSLQDMSHNRQTSRSVWMRKNKCKVTGEIPSKINQNKACHKEDAVLYLKRHFMRMNMDILLLVREVNDLISRIIR